MKIDFNSVILKRKKIYIHIKLDTLKSILKIKYYKHISI